MQAKQHMHTCMAATAQRVTPHRVHKAVRQCLQGVSPANPAVPCNYYGYVRIVADLNKMTLTVRPFFVGCHCAC